jgi:DNA polymerase-3 subunit gamma/tau
MSYQVIARKWRPQTFEEVVGQKATEQTLRNAILQNRIAHAYLFAGPRGVGKTTTARILAKALNCVQGPTPTPCNVCDSCKEIAAGNSLDVLEIDAASNRGIDEIRELRENVKYAAARDRYKVFIIDEVHMLTTEAFNALLKTLEEPPERVVFILATTELHKVPATILSRCQTFNFRTISYQEIYDRLAKISSEEQIQIGEGALSAIVQASEGSMRDAQSLLDQVISFCGKQVEDAQARELLGVIPRQLLEGFTVAIVKNDPRAVLRLVDSLIQSGHNLQHFVREILAHFRDLLLVKVVGEDAQLVPMPAADLARLKELSGEFSEEDLTRFFRILVDTESQLRWSSQPRFHLEMGLMKIMQARRLVSLEKLLAGLEGILQGGSGRESVLLPAAAPSSPPGDSRSLGYPATPQPIASAAGPSPKPRNIVEELKSKVAQRSPMVSSLLDHALEIRLLENGIEIGFPRQSSFHFEMLQSTENLQLLREVMEAVAGGPREVKVVMMDKEPTPANSASGNSVPHNPKVKLMERVKQNPRVQSFLEAFQGEITDVKELEK